MTKLDRYFFKLLIPVWVCFIVVLQFVSIFLGQTRTSFFMSIQEHFLMDTYTIAAQGVYQSYGIDGVRKWIKALSERKEIKFLLIDVKRQKVIDDNLQEGNRFLINNKNNKNEMYKEGGFVFGPYIVETKESLIRLAVNREELFNKFSDSIPKMFIRLSIALIISIVFCYMVVSVIYRKIRKIRGSINEIKKGNFELVKDEKKSQDEISSLFNEVFEMSNTISQLIQSKNRLLQDISHEFRSPLARQLTAIAIAKKKCSELETTHLDRIEEENIKLEQLVSELLEYSKSNRNKELVLEPIDLNKLIGTIIERCNFEFQTCCIQQSISEKLELIGDPGLLYRAIENILRNAVKYAGNDEEIRVTALKTRREVKIIIEDSGPGVTEDQLSIIFHPFHRLENGTHTSTKGYGLGLAIAKEIIDLHQGTITAENRESGGLRVIINVPITLD